MPASLRNTSGLLVLAVLALLATTGTARAATVTFDLWATTGSVTPPGGAATPIWGFASAAGGAAAIPGPVLSVTQGDTVVINLTNGLAEAAALDFPGQALVPDQVGAAPGATTSYTFVADRPGTFLYQAGLLPQAEHQAAAGLYGALVVRPPPPVAGAPAQAYADPASAYDVEAVLVLSELDPALAAAPASFDLRGYAPRYFLINGSAYPATAAIAAAAGQRVLLRYLNAGLQHHSMAVLGLNQAVLAVDGNPRTFGQPVVAETVAPGQTMDAVVTIPAGALAGSRFALYDAAMKLQNGTGTGAQAGFGGMLTFLVTGPAGGTTPTGPTTSGVAAAPSPTDGSVAVTVTATVAADLVTTPSALVTAAELFLDAPGAAGTGLAMAAADGAFDAASEAVTATIPAATMSALLSGTHTVYVHGQDSSLAWGPLASASLVVSRAAPTAGAVAMAPNPASGAVAVTVTSTLTASGGVVSGAEFFIDATGADGSGTAMSGAFGGASATASGTIPPATLAALPSGVHTVYVHGASGTTWGAFNFATLTLDKTGPATTGPSLTPTPTTGAAGVAVHATGDDSASGGANVVAARYSVDGGAPVAMAVNAASPVASLDATIPAATAGALAEGAHPVAIQSQDALGNWGAAATITLVIDRTGPATSGVTATPTPADATTSMRVSATVSDGASVAALAEGFIDPAGTPAPGTGFRLAPSDGAANATTEVFFADVPATTLSQLTFGSHAVAVRGQDAAGNWGALASASFTRSGVAVADAYALTANTSTTPQQLNVASPGLLRNDTPAPAGGSRSAILVSGPVRTSGTGAGTIRVTCGGATTTGVCANGSFRATFTPVTSTSGATRQASKRGTYQFTYSEIVNGVTSRPATVTITVN